MGTYKVIQDIEAEDKFVGPLTLRQFIFAFIGMGIGYAGFLMLTRGLWVGTLILLPFFAFCMFFAFPFGKDQPTEVWALAKFRFLFIPRKRIWDQSGMKELVTITAPKVVEKHYTDGLSQSEVKSRLSALANTLDSRGWAIKNVNAYSQPSYLSTNTTSDRLISTESLPQEVPPADIYASDDILDEKNNRTAQQFQAMINQSEQAHRQAVLQTVQNGGQPATPQQPANYWFMNQPDPTTVPAGNATFSAADLVTPGAPSNAVAADTGADEQALLERLHKQKATEEHQSKGHTKVINPLGSQPIPQAAHIDPTPPAQTATAPATKPVDPALLQLASNDNLNIATIAREANKANELPKAGADGEVVISLR